MDFIIYYEHETRELENCVLLQYELIRRGYKAVVVKNSSYRALLYKTLKKPKVIVVPYCYTMELMKGFVPYNNKKSVKVVNLQLEQVLSKAWEELGFHNPKGVAIKAFHITWGRKTKERLFQNNINTENILLTGAIHLDFLKKQFRNYYLSKKELAELYNIRKDKKWVMYISSFTYTSIKGNISLDKLKENISNGTNEEMSGKLVDDMYDLSIRSRRKTLEWIDKLLNEEDLVFIYRPHPAETKDTLDIQTLKKAYPDNFFCIDELSIRQWILTCDILATWFSTSIIEAYFANKQCYIVRPYDFPKNMESVAYEDCKTVNQYEDFKKIAYEQVNSFNKEEFPISEKIISEYYGEPTNELTCIKICNNLENILKDDNEHKYIEISNHVSMFYFLGKIIQYFLSVFYIVTGFNIGLVFSRKILSRINRKSEKQIKHQAEKLFKKLKETRYWTYAE